MTFRKVKDWLTVIIIFGVLFILIAFIERGFLGEDEKGRATVLDGDSLKIGESTIRLHGIDAPEYEQTCAATGGGTWPCGRRAASRLRALVKGKTVTCKTRTIDRHFRNVATCTAGERLLNAVLVEEGLAWAYRLYFSPYEKEENVARARKRGIWQADTEPAWVYRETRP
ncbi:MAG: thermonuclease family protein [Pseudomonadota bacterium]